MNIAEANGVIAGYYRKSAPTADDDFLFTEAVAYMIEKTKSPRYMMELGGWHYERRNFGLALKYYEMAAEYKSVAAYECLGYIWYYGRTGEKDYEKAFNYFSLAAKAGDLEASYKVADMYKNGYFVEKDESKYKAIIKDLFERVKNDRDLFSPLPQIFIRAARIKAEEGEKDEAVRVYRYAKSFLAQRLAISAFFGDINNMKWLTEELYALTPPDPVDIDLYDLFVWLREPRKTAFYYDGKKHSVESSEEDGETVVCFDGAWYRSISDFFNKAKIGDRKLTSLYKDLYCFEVYK